MSGGFPEVKSFSSNFRCLHMGRIICLKYEDYCANEMVAVVRKKEVLRFRLVDYVGQKGYFVKGWKIIFGECDYTNHFVAPTQLPIFQRGNRVHSAEFWTARIG